MNQFQGRHNLPKFTQEEIDNLNRLASIKLLEPIINNFPKQQLWAQMGSLKDGIIPLLYSLCQRRSRGDTSNSFWEVLFNRSVVSNSLRPMDCSTPGFPVLHYLPEFVQTHVHWVCDAIQPTCPVIPFSYCLQSFPASGSFPVSRLFASGGQSIGASVLASVLPMNIQGWFLLGLTVLIFLLSKGLSESYPSTTIGKHQFFGTAFLMVQLSYPYMTTGKTVVLTIRTFVGRVMSLLSTHCLGLT